VTDRRRFQGCFWWRDAAEAGGALHEPKVPPPVPSEPINEHHRTPRLSSGRLVDIGHVFQVRHRIGDREAVWRLSDGFTATVPGSHPDVAEQHRAFVPALDAAAACERDREREKQDCST